MRLVALIVSRMGGTEVFKLNAALETMDVCGSRWTDSSFVDMHGNHRRKDSASATIEEAAGRDTSAKG